MSDTPETDAVIKNVGDGPYIAYLVHFARKLERERDEARRDLAAANKGAETNAKVNQILCKKLFLLIRRLKRREKEYLNASLGELCEDLFSRNRYEGESIGTRWAREDLELILSKLKIKEEA